MRVTRAAAWLIAGSIAALAAIAQPAEPSIGVAKGDQTPEDPSHSGGHFDAQDIEKGRAQFHRTCSHCHGFNMVNSGTTVYDLRRFPVDDSDRFFNSVTNGKGNMPSFKGALTPEQIQALWAYVGSRGGKEP